MIEETRYTETTVAVERPRISTEPAATIAAAREYVGYVPRFISWGPVWAGVAVAVGINVLLSVLGVAIGLSVAGATDVSAEGLAVSAGIWMIVSALAALFFGGWVAGWLAAPRTPSHGAMHGFVLWCVVTALSAALLTATGGALLGGGLAAFANPQSDDRVANIAGDITGDRNLNLPYGETETTAEDNAEKGAGLAWWTFAILLLSAGAAAIGGSLGHRPVIVGRYTT